MLTPTKLAKIYGFKVETHDQEIGGSWQSPNIIFVSKNTKMMYYAAADWTGKDTEDFVSFNKYPENVITAAHEIAHGLFSRNPENGHKALKKLISIGVPRDVGFESLVDMGGLFLLEPFAITNLHLFKIIEQWLYW